MKSGRGFTIVELLIVIVVIGILAAITIVAYNGIQNRSKVATMQAELSGAMKAIEAYKVTANDTYPLANDCTASPAANTICLKQGPNNTLTYSYDSSTGTYCVSETNGTLTYNVSSHNRTVTNGSCPVINLVVNPSLESSINGWSSNALLNEARIQVGGKWVYQGTRNGTGATGIYASRSLPSTVELNQTYTASAAITMSVSGPVEFSVRRAGTTTNIFDGTFSMVGNVPQRLSITGATGSWDSVYIAVTTSIGNSGMTITMDEAMLTKGSTQYSYADGLSTGWAWLGTPNQSVSIGPAL